MPLAVVEQGVEIGWWCCLRESSARAGSGTHWAPLAATALLDEGALATALATKDLSDWVLDDAGRLARSFWLPSYPCAAAFAREVSRAAERLGHHPHALAIKHKCVEVS